jgi:hypothetical protein
MWKLNLVEIHLKAVSTPTVTFRRLESSRFLLGLYFLQKTKKTFTEKMMPIGFTLFFLFNLGFPRGGTVETVI